MFKDFLIFGLTAVVAGQAYWIWVSARRVDTVEKAMEDVERELVALAKKHGWKGGTEP